MRVTVILSLVLICGSFASAAAIQLRLDYSWAIDQARHFEMRRAQTISANLSNVLNHYAMLGAAFANRPGTETSAALSEAGGRALNNILLLSRDGMIVSQMKGTDHDLPQLSAAILHDAEQGRVVIPQADDHGVTILFPHAEHIVAVQLDHRALFDRDSMEAAVLATLNGRMLYLGTQWQHAPTMNALNLNGATRASHIIEAGGERRLIALAQAPGWPIAVGASIPIGEALSSWYGSLPIYFFFIVGPAVAGAGLAVVFVREFERRARAAAAIRNLRAVSRNDAKLLIRLADAERRAVESERSKSEFVAHMSHELRTPLNAVIGFSEVIAKGYFGDPGHPKYVEYANDIAVAGRQLHAKIGDVLDFANLEAGRYPVDMTRIDVADIARTVVNELAGRAFSRRIRLTVSLVDSAPALGDIRAVKRILCNLLGNALQFTPSGGTVRIEVRREDGAIVASVRDNGLGFTREEQEAAGLAFTRFDRPGAFTGVGMGLAIAMALARRMNGVVRLAGTTGHGTTAELRLPID